MKLFTASLVVLAAATAVHLGHASRAQSLTARVFGRNADAAVPRHSVQVNAAKLDHFLMNTFANDAGQDGTIYSSSYRSEYGERDDYNFGGDYEEAASQAMHDIIIVLDSSGSIGSDDFLKAKQFLAEFVSLIPSTISPDVTRVACISFSSSDKIITEFNFLDHTNKSAVIQAINQVNYQGGETYTAKALRRAQALFASSGRREAKKVLFLATDGRSNGGGNPAVPANEMKNSDKGDVQIEVVAVTQNVNAQEVEAIASSPPKEHVYYINDFNDATSITAVVRANMASRGMSP